VENDGGPRAWLHIGHRIIQQVNKNDEEKADLRREVERLNGILENVLRTQTTYLDKCDDCSAFCWSWEYSCKGWSCTRRLCANCCFECSICHGQFCNDHIDDEHGCAPCTVVCPVCHEHVCDPWDHECPSI
jgi:hypothetical protein